VQDQIIPPTEYLSLLEKEIESRAVAIQDLMGQKLETIYFGGGTPSLVPAEILISVLKSLRGSGFQWDSTCEITLEINPATVDERKLAAYIEAGFNRFSVGAQTFNDALLKSVHREHNSEQTRQTLHLLQSHQLNYSFDLLFALPGQTLEILRQDLDEVLRFLPPHVSPYCLTVPEGHVLSGGRPEEGIQVEMFDMIHSRLSEAGFNRYEISNYARPGFESRHNNLYWLDDAYWGLGLSAHSYAPTNSLRFWNPNSIGAYADNLQNAFTGLQNQSPQLWESLAVHQSLTDFCHTSLRLKRGLLSEEVVQKFGEKILQICLAPLAQLVEDGLLEVFQSPSQKPSWRLTDRGLLLSNQVFGVLTFLAGELP
jgi:oxygen-independent coproporphyrinogen-3 oxidase